MVYAKAGIKSDNFINCIVDKIETANKRRQILSVPGFVEIEAKSNDGTKGHRYLIRTFFVLTVTEIT